jgi:oligopeptide/dipeptide ABC transporter ATP-binding protein
MYLGKVVETATTKELFQHPLHPYTHALLSGIPVPDVACKPRRIVLTGDVPSPVNPPAGCRFHTRCPFVLERCRKEEPLLEAMAPGHWAACHRKHGMAKLVVEKFGQKRIGGQA